MKNEIICLILKEIDLFKYDLKKLIQDLNQKEPLETEEQNGQNSRLKSQNAKGKIINQNKLLSGNKSNQYYNQNKQSNGDESHQYYNQNKQLSGNKSHQYCYGNKQSACDNFNKKSYQNKPLSGSKFYQLNNQKIQHQNKRLDIFTSKDIQEENKKITNIFEKEASNYIDNDEEIENENIAKFLIQVANVSRKAYNNSNELFINMFQEFSKFMQEENNISTLKNDVQLRKEFSSWVKEYEKGSEGKKKYENYFNSFKGKGQYAKEDYISTLLSQLTILYFHCEISFPIIDVDFNLNSGIIFNNEKMFDFINTGMNRRVDFIILPSLSSDNKYLENGKFWVFTYKQNTFKFGRFGFENLVNKQEKYISPQNRQVTGSKFYQFNNQKTEQNKQATSSNYYLSNNRIIEQNRQAAGYNIYQSNNRNIDQSRQATGSKFYQSNNQKIEQNRQIINNQNIGQNRQETGSNFYQANNQNFGQNKQVNISKYYQASNQNNKNIELNRQFKESNKKININQNKRLDNFTSKDIQEENKEITRIFQKETLNYIDDDEEIENENIAKFLIQVANVSRKAYNNSNELFINMFQEFSKFMQEENNISTLKNDVQLRKEFSSWVKEYEKGSEGKKKYENYFNSFKGKGQYAKEDYISTLLSQLTILYFHCELSFPIVDVDFNLNSEIIFNHEKMIDFINKGNNRKVDFIILPSLFSNGNYLENGKFWVFTYKKDTFKFGKLRFENLVNKQDKYNENYSNNNIPNSQYNNRDLNSLRKQANNYCNSNINYYPREREVKYYKHYIDKTKNKLMIIKK